MATGHYANIQTEPKLRLLQAIDSTKDQTYFLSMVKIASLSKVMFPLGNLRKTQVRQIAQEANLPNAKRKDSVGLCFVGKRKWSDFLSSYISTTPGKFKNIKGIVLGEHKGLGLYTVGQRAALSKGDGTRWFCAKKDYKENVIYLCEKDDPLLNFKDSIVKDINWLCEDTYNDIKNDPDQIYLGKVRYSVETNECKISIIDHTTIKVTFVNPIKAITKGQIFVLYTNEGICAAGGVLHPPEIEIQ
eukprot:TRINITY_DN2162_c0_g1_i1.p2 TRINITY_DN2162_c0_g1~~TRINITY_DN2162_c0_g1_i1.p2  ORF type:complete len:280 (+),score=46.84 TRINITY_DN2162_c0_g1_i1:106-840(+)